MHALLEVVRLLMLQSGGRKVRKAKEGGKKGEEKERMGKGKKVSAGSSK